MSSYKLYGDAKATAKEADPLRKSKRLTETKEKLDKDPSSANKIEYANALSGAGRYSEAEEVLTSMLSDGAANDLAALFELGFVYKNLKRNNDAIGIFKRLVGLDPKNPLALSAENEIWRLDPTYEPSWKRK